MNKSPLPGSISGRYQQPDAAGSVLTDLYRPSILAVDDEAYNTDLLQEIFSEDYVFLSASTGAEALVLAACKQPDVVLLDVIMPGMDGYEVCGRLKADPATSNSLIIFITSLNSVAHETRGLQLGAVDYVTKPLNPASVRARVGNHIRFKRAQEQLLHLNASIYEKQMQAELERSAEIDRHAKRELQQKDDFLSRVSHELRSPLNSIYSFSTIIADGLAGSTTPQQNQHLGIILKNVDQLQSMIDDLLQVTQSRSGKILLETQYVSVSEAVVYALQTLQSAAKAKNISFASGFNQSAPLVFADAVRLRQILTILIENAIKYTAAGGSIRIKTALWPEDSRFLLFRIEDTGCGISLDQCERIFDHLYQVSASDQGGRCGLGLGLYIAKDLVTRQDGQIWVVSEPAQGSSFLFTMPLHDCLSEARSLL